MRNPRLTVREEHRVLESQRAGQSISLSQKFGELKSLTVEFGYFSSDGISRNRQIKYTVNPQFAKSVFRLDCLNDECVYGDFDLSEAITHAVTAKSASVAGEMCCQGWLSKSTIGQIHCHSILRYTLALAYSEPDPVEKAQP